MRITMSWIRCDVCGRRLVNGSCLLGGAKLSLCLYCLRALEKACGKGARGPSRPRKQLVVDEGLLKKFG
ncbi:MAG: hypothetical protein GSR85_10420 [Desulfurococcales archaeon]|nr:hypothetical protein [Desulfurococcales archaeon]